MNQHEFDNYIKNYRSDCDKYVGLSGENSTYFAEYKAKKLYEWLPTYHNQSFKMLDFGCGDGVMTSYAKQCFPKADVVGVDPSAKSIDCAKELHTNITFQETDGRTLNFEDGSFDVIYAAGAFHHIPFEDHEMHMKEVYRVLKPGGHFVMFELNSLNPLTVYTFNRNPIDQNATMMNPRYGLNLVKKHAQAQIKFYCFFPKFLGALRGLEPFMTKIPFGALYAVISEKR
jgi:ubiquinone/menaquinone biosynthesis C-methylase UbiE